MSNQSNFPPPSPSDFSPNPPYGQPSFGQPPAYGYQEPRRQNRTALYVCGGLVAVVFLCCCSCAAVGILAPSALANLFRSQPFAAVAFWGFGIQLNNWDIALDMTCENSQARTFTEDYKEKGTSFTSFNFDTNSSDKIVDVTATIVENGQSRAWSATFTTRNISSSDNNQCIESIRETN